ncbi:hypothetical protein LJB42_004200 [Komagataella kurtzmanii]|nr:hypothetical protein LJB42_004200 [Komagataella kurtzmanii]
MSFPFEYQEQISGYWGPSTATIDWCEENYVISWYFAEFINSTTNLAFYFLFLYHLRSAIKNEHGFLFIFTSVGACVVGLGSWLFHMTLKYEFQLLDELPMIYVTALPFAYIYGVDKGYCTKVALYVAMALLMAVLTIIYCSVYKNPVFHQVSYAVLNFGIILRSLVLIQRHVPDAAARRDLYRLLGLALGEFLTGFVLWNLDTVYCTYLRQIRRYWNLPFGVILELHGWWHILTALGIYHFILYSEILKVWHEGRQSQYSLLWHYGFLGEVHKDDRDKNIKTD